MEIVNSPTRAIQQYMIAQWPATPPYARERPKNWQDRIALHKPLERTPEADSPPNGAERRWQDKAIADSLLPSTPTPRSRGSKPRHVNPHDPIAVWRDKVSSHYPLPPPDADDSEIIPLPGDDDVFGPFFSSAPALNHSSRRSSPPTLLTSSETNRTPISQLFSSADSAERCGGKPSPITEPSTIRSGESSLDSQDEGVFQGSENELKLNFRRGLRRLEKRKDKEEINKLLADMSTTSSEDSAKEDFKSFEEKIELKQRKAEANQEKVEAIQEKIEDEMEVKTWCSSDDTLWREFKRDIEEEERSKAARRLEGVAKEALRREEAEKYGFHYSPPPTPELQPKAEDKTYLNTLYPCLQCAIKGMRCSITLPACTRCMRNGETCLPQRQVEWKDRDAGPYLEQNCVLVRFPGEGCDYEHEQSERIAAVVNAQWERKIAAEATFLETFQDRLDRQNWVLPRKDGPRGRYKIRWAGVKRNSPQEIIDKKRQGDGQLDFYVGWQMV